MNGESVKNVDGSFICYLLLPTCFIFYMLFGWKKDVINVNSLNGLHF